MVKRPAPEMSQHASERFAERFPGAKVEHYLANLRQPSKRERADLKRWAKKNGRPRGRSYLIAFQAVFVVARTEPTVVTVFQRRETEPGREVSKSLGNRGRRQMKLKKRAISKRRRP